jgi:hypothetical protein
MTMNGADPGPGHPDDAPDDVFVASSPASAWSSPSDALATRPQRLVSNRSTVTASTSPGTNMNRSCTLIGAIVALCVALCGSAFAAADGATLFNSASFMSQAQEKASLNASEAKSLAINRASSLFISVQPITLNRAALDTGVITLVTPNGKEFQYIGAKVQHNFQSDRGARAGFFETTSYSWSGRSKTGWLTISWDEDSYYGTFHENFTTYGVFSLPGARFGVLSEFAHPTGQLDIGDGSASAAAASLRGTTKK